MLKQTIFVTCHSDVNEKLEGELRMQLRCPLGTLGSLPAPGFKPVANAGAPQRPPAMSSLHNLMQRVRE
jgi:hypothetical protein